MNDRTPADVIAEAVDRWDTDMRWYIVAAGPPPGPVHGYVMRALAAAGFRVVPIPDDNTRALAARLREWHAAAVADCSDHDVVLYDDLLTAAAFLDGQPQDRPEQCLTDDDGELPEAFCVVLDELIVLKPDGPFDREQVARSIVAMLSETGLLVGGSGDTR